METNQKNNHKPRRPNAQSRDPKRNRRLLLDATLDSIADVGISETTVSSIIERAGLSRGMIHLHFGGKDALLESAAEMFSNEYYTEMDLRLARASDDPAQIILAVIRADLSPETLNERSVRIWHAFRGEARNNQGIASHSDTRDKRLRHLICNAFEAIAKQTDLTHDPMIAHEATLGTLALLEGMWVDYMTHPDHFKRENAILIICRFLNGIFPGAFKTC